MILTFTTLLVIIVLFLSTLTRSTFGFGDALVAMPLLTFVIDVQTATPIVALVGASIGLIIVGGDWRHIDLKSAWLLIAASIVGIPIGLFFLTSAPEGWVKGVLGLVIMLFSLYALTRPALPQIQSPQWAYGFGFIAGVFGGAYNINGPPIVIYGTLRRWPPVRFRATLQGFFVPNFMIIALGHGLAGLWTPQVWQLYVLAMPGIVLAIFLGRRLNRHFEAKRFERLLYLALLVLGALLVV